MRAALALLRTFLMAVLSAAVGGAQELTSWNWSAD